MYSHGNLPTVEVLRVAAFIYCLLTFLLKSENNMYCLLKTVRVFPS